MKKTDSRNFNSRGFGGWDPRNPRMRGGVGFGGFRNMVRARKGDVQIAILRLLIQEDMHGYQIIQELSRLSEGVWSPGAGSIYPTLQSLEDEGFITARSEGQKKIYSITKSGQKFLGKHANTTLWEDFVSETPEIMIDLRQTLFNLNHAVMQVEQVGDTEKLEKAEQLLRATQKSLYLILADALSESESAE